VKPLIVQERIQLLPFLQQNLKGFKKKTIQHYLRHGSISLNQSPIRNPHHWLKPQDQLKILKTQQVQEFSSYKIKILYEDSFLVVIDKPSDLLTVPTPEYPVENALVQTQEILKKRGSLRKHHLFAAHRLDLGTSGTLLFTKSKEVLHSFWKHWSHVQKDYLALVKGIPEPPEHTISLKLKEAEDQKVYVDSSATAQEAFTRYKTLEISGNYALLEVALLTGHKHQIRVHLADSGYPILGDRKYGDQAQALPRLALHAWKLSFEHPKTQKKIYVQSPPPVLFQEFLEKQRC
jgi:23S rRNA pseudouridine1911/1915/1917 synthase